MEKHCDRVSDFFNERKKRSHTFADKALSLWSKWKYAKSKLPFTDAAGHRKYLRELFEELVFSDKELSEVEGRNYLRRVFGETNPQAERMKWRSTSRNPVVNLRLARTQVRTGMRSENGEIVVHRTVVVPDSWVDNVWGVLNKGGNVDVDVAQPPGDARRARR